MQVPDSKSARVRTVAFAGRSSDLLLSGRLPVVHRHDSGRSIVRKLCDEAHSSGFCPGFSPDSLLFPVPNGNGKTSITKIEIILTIMRLGKIICIPI